MKSYRHPPTDRPTAVDWPLAEPIHPSSGVKHSYCLTPPDLSAAREAARVAPSKIDDDEAPYQQSNVPYLLLVTIIFLFNGFILFFGPALRERMNGRPVEASASTTQTQRSETTWQEDIFDRNGQTNAFGGSSDFVLPSTGTLTTYRASESVDAPPSGSTLPETQTNLFR